jgi:hypothetical protein
MPRQYQPETIEGLTAWWKNIQANTAALTSLGFTAGEIAAIQNDAKWAVFAYETLRNLYESYHQTILAYAERITYGPIDGPIGEPTEPPEFPDLPTPVVLAGVERRRAKWVETAKAKLTYTQSLGEALRIVAPEVPFDPDSYVAKLTNVKSLGPRSVSGRFRKEYGNVEGVILQGRKEGTTGWTELGRFSALPFTANVPVTGSTPEVWQFQVRAYKRDVPFGAPSDIVQVTILP